MWRHTVKIVLAVLFILSLSGGGQAFVFADPTGLYNTSIWDHWVYQAHQSTALLTVFYGEGDYDLLYFERLGPVQDASALALAQRSLALYAEEGGLKGFEEYRPVKTIHVAGQAGVVASYSYGGEPGTRLFEVRVFLLLPNKEGFSIALSRDDAWEGDFPALFKEILDQWRWLF